jgi:acyl carrier protein
MITISEFIKLLEGEFEDIGENVLHENLNYREIPNFSSMHALIIIAMIDSNFDVLLTGSDLKSANTIRDLYDIVQNKLNQ